MLLYAMPMLRFRCLSLCGVAVKQGPSFSSLHGFRHLQLYSTSSSSPQSLVDQLVHSLSFPQQQALAIADKLIQTRRLSKPSKVSDLNVLRKADSVINFFKQNGLDQSHIRDVVSSEPQILLCKVDKTLKPKFESLQEHGFSGPDLALVVSVNPRILLEGLESAVIPGLQALRELLSDGNAVGIMKTMKRLRPGFFTGVAKYLLPNAALLRNYGIPMELIRQHLIGRPSCFLLKTKSFEDLLIRVEEEFGILRGSRMFLHCVQLLANNSERNIESKFQVFKSFGWTHSDILEMMRRNPNCFRKSKEKIEKSLNFLMKELGYEPKYVITNAMLLTSSLEGKLVPRHRTLMVLKEKGLVRQSYAFTSAVLLTESKFLKKFVLPFKEVHQFYARQIGIPVGLLTERSMDTCSQRGIRSAVLSGDW